MICYVIGGSVISRRIVRGFELEIKRDNCRREDLAGCSSEDYSALKVYAGRKDIKHRKFSCAKNVGTSVVCILCYGEKRFPLHWARQRNSGAEHQNKRAV